jgi:hypothetical protein
VGHPEVEGPPQDHPLGVDEAVIPEVLPQAGQFDPLLPQRR